MTPPSDKSAEAACVGSCLLDGSCVPLVAAVVQPGDIWAPALQRIYEACLKLSDEGIQIDLIQVRNRMLAAGTLEEAGGVDFLVQVVESLPSAANAEHYARLVAHAARARRVWAEAERAYTALNGEGGDWRKPEAVDRHVGEIVRAGDVSATRRSTIMELVDSVMRDLGGGLAGANSGIERIDVRNGGLWPGHYLVLAALTSRGKTSLALQIAAVVARTRPVLVYSCEMSEKALVRRMLTQATQIPADELQRGEAYDMNRERVDTSAGHIRDLHLHIVADGRATPSHIRGSALSVKRREGDLALVVVDYLQLLHADDPSGSREADVSEISGRLKGLAVEMDCTVLALAQFNRQANALPKSGRPHMHHLRESGRIEQDADGVWILHREQEKCEPDRLADVGLFIDKAREGPTGVVALQWLANTTTFFQVIDHETRGIGERCEHMRGKEADDE